MAAQRRDISEATQEAEPDGEQKAPTRRRKRGRPPGSKDPDNIPVLSFWAQQEMDRALSEDGEKITIRESIRRVMRLSTIREGAHMGIVAAKLDSAVKRVRTFRQDQKKRK